MAQEKKGGKGATRAERTKRAPGWMKIQWARDTGLLAARWGINTG